MDVERWYRTRIESMSPVERVRRADALFRWSGGVLVRSILQERGALSDLELAAELAVRRYGSDPAARPWLLELRARAGR